MYEILFKTAITFLVIYALIDILTRFYRLLTPGNKQEGELFIVIKVKNQENNLECIIRSVIWTFLSRNGGTNVPNILVVDLGSEDSTSLIAQKLCDDYDFIFYTTEKLSQMEVNNFSS